MVVQSRRRRAGGPSAPTGRGRRVVLALFHVFKGCSSSYVRTGVAPGPPARRRLGGSIPTRLLSAQSFGLRALGGLQLLPAGVEAVDLVLGGLQGFEALLDEKRLGEDGGV